MGSSEERISCSFFGVDELAKNEEEYILGDTFQESPTSHVQVKKEEDFKDFTESPLETEIDPLLENDDKKALIELVKCIKTENVCGDRQINNIKMARKDLDTVKSHSNSECQRKQCNVTTVDAQPDLGYSQPSLMTVGKSMQFELKKQTEQVHFNKLYNCCTCGKDYLTKNSLNSHKYKKHKFGNSHLKKKQEVFIMDPTEKNCKQIISSQSKENTKNIVDQNKVKKIRLPKSNHNHKSVECEKCHKFYHSNWYFLKHSCKVLKRIKKCEICNKTFCSEFYYSEHKLNKHSENTHSKKIYNCSKCSKVYFKKTSLTSHFYDKHRTDNKPSLTCEICQNTLKDRRNLLEHMRRKHNKSHEFTCGHCSAIFHFKKKLVYHMQTNHLPPTYKCTKCSELFSTRVSLKLHLRVKHGKVCMKVCDLCGKTFKQKVSLTRHLMVHTGELPFCCDICGKRFRTESNLHQHSVLHSDIRKFSCDMCSKSFKVKHHLRQHMAVHGLESTPKYGKRGCKIKN